MTTTTATSAPATTASPRFSVAGMFLEGLAGQDYDRLASALCDDAHLRALLPMGLVEWHGADEVKSAFVRFFGDVERFELVDAVVGEVGSRLHLRWRVRLQGKRLGDGWFAVEQVAYADTDDNDRISHLSLVCSGYCREPNGD